ncbi:MAG: hypothetical protein JWM82_2424 [Myxococcales bacterium]|nr:hypothetical protein [Myxococcales bacterium]
MRTTTARGRTRIVSLVACLVSATVSFAFATPAVARSKRAAGVADPCKSEAAGPGPGSLDPFRPPVLRAAELNAAGKIPYRQGKWEEARAQYRAAEAADPELLAAKLNVACSFVREERFAEATAEVVALLELGYVPWAREILEAADLGALKARPEGKEIQRAMAAAAARWSEGLPASVLFVARKGAALRVPDGPGVFILNPHQEVWAFTPTTRRYRQLTAEDGHVVALARSPDGKSLVYATAEKLIRGAAPQGRKPTDLSLRGVALHELSLVTMVPGASASIAADVRKLDIGVGVTGEFVFEVDGDAGKGVFQFAPTGQALVPLPAGGRAIVTLATLTPHGASAPRSAPVRAGSCDAQLVEQAAGATGVRNLLYRSPGGPQLTLTPRNGAGRVGLSIP